MTARRNPTVDPRIGERDAGLRRLRRATALGLAAAGALSVVFGELAANAFHGTAKARATVQTSSTSKRVTATPPPLVSAGSSAQAAAAAAQAPVQSQSPPVAVSGGT